EHTLSLHCDGFHDRLALETQLFTDGIHGHHVGEIALVKLQHVGNCAELELVLLEVLFQVLERFQIGVQPLLLRIRDKNHSIRALQDQFAASFVKDLSGDRVQVKPSFETSNRAQIEWKKIKKKRAI